MIHVDRGEAPTVFISAKLEEERIKAKSFFERPAAERAQQRYKFRGMMRMDGALDALVNLFHGKCAYCESQVTPSGVFTIDRFRPCNGALNLDGTFDPDHYWWLAYEWFNLYPACRVCNSMKANRFPVARRRVKPGATQAELVAEQALLLDPCRDQPEKHLVFSKDGLVASETTEGRATIDVLGLNRTALVEERKAAYRFTEVVLNSFAQRLHTADISLSELNTLFKEVNDPQQPYLAMRRQLLTQWMMQNKIADRMARRMGQQAVDALINMIPNSGDLSALWILPQKVLKKLRVPPPSAEAVETQPPIVKTLQEKQAIVKNFQAEQASVEAYSVEDENRKEHYYRKRRLIERIELHNFKAIRDLTISFGTSEPQATPWLLLLGENGTGKSSILQAVALTLMGERHREELRENLKLDATRFVRYGTRSGYVKIYLVGVLEPIELHFRKDSPRFEGNATDPKTPLLGYGATRLLPRDNTSPPSPSGLARTHNLFNPFVPLHDATTWLSHLPKSNFNNIARGLKELMLLEDEDRLFKSSKGEIKVKTLGEHIPLRDLSDGYQTVLALAVDIMSVIQERWEVMEIAEGIVLVDELDAHLHPRWKMQIVKRLRQTFPHIQFIVATHDPLCLRGIHQGEVIVMRRDTKHRIMALADLPDPDALRIDQILTSEFFGLNSTIDPELEKLFEEYYDLLALRSLTEAQTARLAELQQQLEGRELLGTNRRERMMIEAADLFVAKEAREPSATRRDELRDETRNKIAELWASLDEEV